jgi:predicted ester cyclase
MWTIRTADLSRFPIAYSTRRSVLGGIGANLLMAIGGMPRIGRVNAQEATPHPCPNTTEEENIAIARAFHEEVINRRNPELLSDILHPEVVHHAAGGYPPVQAADEVTSMMGDFLAAFSDLHYNFDFFVVVDDMVVERYTATGTHDGQLGALEPTGRTATWTEVNIFRIEYGQIIEIWSEVDALNRNRQLTSEVEATPSA